MLFEAALSWTSESSGNSARQRHNGVSWDWTGDVLCVCFEQGAFRKYIIRQSKDCRQLLGADRWAHAGACLGACLAD